MAKLVESGQSDNWGENLFVSKAVEYLDRDAVIYRNRQILGREFDVCALIPRQGIIVTEVKGWREDSVIGVDNGNAIIIRVGDREETSNPQKQARGYRYALENFIRQGVGLRPLVLHTACLPQISANFFQKRRMNTVLEEPFTFLKEDLSSREAFLRKLDNALALVREWNRDAFSDEAMIKVRSLFEANVVPNAQADAATDPQADAAADPQAGPATNAEARRRDYSIFYYLPPHCAQLSQIIEEMTARYLEGCKLYCVFADMKQLLSALSALDAALSNRGLRRVKDNLENAFDKTLPPEPAAPSRDGIAGFHFSFSALSPQQDLSQPPLRVVNGQCDDKQRAFLTFLSEHSAFNAEQYFVEHADPDKNIMIRAGAGTGKTYAMIARIAYLCYAQRTPLREMADRVAMITFTNDAADQMSRKLKAYFRNLSALCANQPQGREYLTMLSSLERMQISTIHSYAKALMSQLGPELGYGLDLSVTSSEYRRRKKLEDSIDAHIRAKTRRLGPGYAKSLSVPTYEIRDSALAFIQKLRNQSVNISALTSADFGTIPPKSPFLAFHELLADVIPSAETEYENELSEDGRIHLSALISALDRVVRDPSGFDRLRELKKDDGLQFLFVDEFQDTDDAQIEILLRIASALDCKMFLVGDIKQCIYRFRGAEERAFDKVGAAQRPQDWLTFSLRRNYRTDSMLLDMFDKSFSNWNAGGGALLDYHAQDRLIGARRYNGYLKNAPDKFYRCLPIQRESDRIPAVIQEIRRIQRRIQYETGRGLAPSGDEKSVAILVRENWQAELIRDECARAGLDVKIHTGGNLYASAPALDMLTLVNAFTHFDEPDYLYALLRSNFFRLDFPKSNLYDIRARIRDGGWRNQADKKEMANRLMESMSPALSRLPGRDTKWEYLIKRLRKDPVLQVMREVYNALEPWKNCGGNESEYQLNVDLLFEQIISACNADRLTVNALREHLLSCVLSRASVESRRPPQESDEVPIQCVTVHKAKGLEYGHVILPYCSFPMDYVKPSRLYVNAERTGNGIKIGYSVSVGNGGDVLQNDYYDPKAEAEEKSREEARILYVAMTRAIRSFSWVELQGRKNLCWQNLIEKEV